MLTEGKPLYTFASPATQNLPADGATGIQSITDIKELLK
jgi:hypothetical protein